MPNYAVSPETQYHDMNLQRQMLSFIRRPSGEAFQVKQVCDKVDAGELDMQPASTAWLLNASRDLPALCKTATARMQP